MTYALHLLVYFSIWSLLALGLNIITGYAGLLTLAHGAYFAVGAYTYAILSVGAEWTFVPASFLSLLFAAVLSGFVSLPSWRLKGDFFIMATLAVGALFFRVIHNWSSPGAEVGSLQNLTNGAFGIPDIPSPVIFGFRLTGVAEFAALATAASGIIAIVLYLLLRSPWGRALSAMRDDEIAARALGKRVRRLKLESVAVGCGTAGFAGALYASYVGYVQPSLSSLDFSILVVAMMIVGGSGNFRGPIVGAAVLLGIPEILRVAEVPASAAAEIRLLVYGLLLILIVHFRPQGLAGIYRIE